MTYEGKTYSQSSPSLGETHIPQSSYFVVGLKNLEK